MAIPQPGIFALGTRSHYHLELDVRDGVTGPEVVDALQGLREPAVTAGGANLVIGFGPELWRDIAPESAVPPDLDPFTAIQGIDGTFAPATQHDLWIWIHGTGEDVALDVGRAVVAQLAGVAVVGAEQKCFVYKDSRDLTGFIDGTANPPIEQAPGVACIPDGKAGAGGAFVLAQRWVHNLHRFGALSGPEQEAVIGRTKADSVELADDDKPPTSHIARAETDGPDGDELEIYRRSTPFGTVREQGLYFLAFGADRTRFDLMLARLFGTSGDGLRDHLLDFTAPVSGAYYFAPSLDVINELIAAEGD